MVAPRADQSDRLTFVQWDTPQDLRDKLVDVLTDQFGTDEAGLEREVELSLGGREDEKGRIYFNLGNGEKSG